MSRARCGATPSETLFHGLILLPYLVVYPTSAARATVRRLPLDPGPIPRRNPSSTNHPAILATVVTCSSASASNRRLDASVSLKVRTALLFSLLFTTTV